MKLNNKGFAISTIMYMVLVMAIILITLTLSLLSSRKIILDKTKQEAKNNIYGYQQIEYIESTGTQYIDTGLTMPDGFKSELKVLISNSEQGAYLIGSHKPTSVVTIDGIKMFDCDVGDNSCERNGLGLKKYGTELKLQLGLGKTVNTIDGLTIETNKEYDIEFSTIIGNSYLIIDGTKYLQTSEIDNRFNENIILFGNNDTIKNGFYTFIGKIYYCKIYSNDDKLLRDFIPCYRKSDGKIGMYDKVYNKFYPVKELKVNGSVEDALK